MMFKSYSSIKIPFFEILGILTVISFLWLDELFDLPHLIFGTQPTPINYLESIFETCIILLLGVLIVLITFFLLKKIRYLEGLLHLCVFCKKIRVNGDWFEIERYITENSGAEFSHGLCPECIEKYYGEFLGPKKLKKILENISNETKPEAM